MKVRKDKTMGGHEIRYIEWCDAREVYIGILKGNDTGRLGAHEWNEHGRCLNGLVDRNLIPKENE